MSKLGEIALRGLEFPSLNGRERSVLRHIADCQTERMGGNVLSCECGHREVHYNSCRDRHCPLCQGAARARWVRARLSELLPCPYFHVVFTVPHELLSLAQANRHLFYDALFMCVRETLLAVCAKAENLGARVGGMAILHTWNQKLAFHPHLHCIIPGGGISPDGLRWIAGNPTYLVSVRRLSAVFRGKLLSHLETSIGEGELQGDESALRASLRKAAQKAFVVYAKPPFGGPEQVVKYLGRYTHRVGISEQRIVSADAHQVSFSWIDRAAGHAHMRMTLSQEAFIQKFMLHILPKGLRKIRYFGYMGNRDRTLSLAHVRALIQACADHGHEGTARHILAEELPETSTDTCVWTICPKCGSHMKVERSIRSSNAPRCLKDRLAFLQEIHGPAPNEVVMA